MKLQEIIESKKSHILSHLYEWAETFELEFDDEGEKTSEQYDIVFSLAKRLEDGKCTEEDYENIFFHIEQINYNERKVIL